MSDQSLKEKVAANLLLLSYVIVTKKMQGLIHCVNETLVGKGVEVLK
jgi:hypothetical protein